MTYCSKCGQKNEDEAVYCSKCGSPLKDVPRKREDECDKTCEEECSGSGGSKAWAIFWGIVVILIGAWIVFELALKNLADQIPELAWTQNITFPFWFIILGVIGLLVIILGIRIIAKNR